MLLGPAVGRHERFASVYATPVPCWHDKMAANTASSNPGRSRGAAAAAQGGRAGGRGDRTEPSGGAGAATGQQQQQTQAGPVTRRRAAADLARVMRAGNRWMYADLGGASDAHLAWERHEAAVHKVAEILGQGSLANNITPKVKERFSSTNMPVGSKVKARAAGTAREWAPGLGVNCPVHAVLAVPHPRYLTSLEKNLCLYSAATNSLLLHLLHLLLPHNLHLLLPLLHAGCVHIV